MVNIDTVYQRVLALANKEQRGYITPQEFNLFANQVQMDMFEQYFYDLNQFMRLPGNDTEYADVVSIIEEKIQIFDEVAGANDVQTWQTAGPPTNLIIPDDVYRIHRVETNNIECEILNTKDFNRVKFSPLTMPSESRPICNIRNNILRINNGEEVDPADTDVGVFFIRIPNRVSWGYMVVNEKALYNENTSVNFELHRSEETDIVLKILALAGISIKDPSVYQAASTEDNKNITQEKQ